MPIQVYRGDKGIATTDSQPGTGRDWVVSITLRQLNPLRKTQYEAAWTSEPMRTPWTAAQSSPQPATTPTALYHVPPQLNTRTSKRYLVNSQKKLVRFHVVTMMTTKLIVVWDVTPCNVVEIHWNFKRISYLHLSCRRISLYRKMDGMIYQNGWNDLPKWMKWSTKMDEMIYQNGLNDLPKWMKWSTKMD
jgi:hypothetical protein